MSLNELAFDTLEIYEISHTSEKDLIEFEKDLAEKFQYINQCEEIAGFIFCGSGVVHQKTSKLEELLILYIEAGNDTSSMIDGVYAEHDEDVYTERIQERRTIFIELAKLLKVLD